MEGRYPNGILFAMTSCPDPTKEEEANYWYNHIHIPDVTSPGIFRHAIRFANTNQKPGEPEYIATYETSWEDVAKAWATQRERSASLGDRGRSPNIQPVTVGVFKKLGGEFYAASRPVRGILAVMVNCTDPAREEEFNSWYNDVHIPDILDTGLYQTAYRYESLDPQATKAKYLALYETHYGDPGKAGEEMGKVRTNWEKRGRLFDAIELVYRLTARRIWPMD